MAGKKYKFVEDFINPATGAPYDDANSPQVIKTKFFGVRTLHQIDKIHLKEIEQEKTVSVVNENGEYVGEKKETEKTYIETIGEKGGWIEHMGNLSQVGDCWIGEEGIVCGDAFVGDDVQIAGGEIGDNARILNTASVSGNIGIGGNAVVWGAAQVSGDGRLAIYGNAHVQGIVDGKSEVFGDAHIGPEATISDSAKVYE